MSTHRLATFTAVVCPVLAAAGCGAPATGPGADAPPVGLTADYSEIVAVPGSLRRVQVRVVDGHGDGVRDVPVTFAVSSGNGDMIAESPTATTDGTGTAAVDWLLPSELGHFVMSAHASHGGAALAGSPRTFTAQVESFTPAVDESLNPIEQHIAWSVTQSRASLAANRQIASFIHEKIRALEPVNLASIIVAERYFAATTIGSMDGRELELVAVFPGDTLRMGAETASAALAPALPVLEAFMDRAFPAPSIRIWYGFSVGASGGGGAVHLEDLGTYQARVHLIPAPLPHLAILFHELAHSYIGNEALTQFLELLVYNVVETGSSDPQTWSHKRQYTGVRASNTGVHALLDIHALIGHDAMARAYRTLHELRPPYGQPLSAEARQAFVDEAPSGLESQVAAKADQIGY